MATSDQGPFWKPAPATRKDLGNFGLIFAAIVLALGGYRIWDRGPEAATVPLLVVLVLTSVSLVWPTLLKPLWWPWMVVAQVLGFVNSHLLLSLVLYLLFTPIGLLMRLLGKDPLDGDFRQARRTVEDGGSLWHRRDSPHSDRQHYKRQF